MASRFLSLLGIAVLVTVVGGLEITAIQGPGFQSPLAGQWVHNVTGVVSAKDKYGFWLLGEPSNDMRESHGLRVYSPQIAAQVQAGDRISLSGRVEEYRQSSRPNDLFLTELEVPYNLEVISTKNTIKPIVLSRNGHRSPPPTRFSVLDAGLDSWLSIPSNTTRLEDDNPTLQPDQYGLDFWESLEGQLVTIPSPVAANFPDRYGSVWVYGDWDVKGKNRRGGLTLTFVDGAPDANSGSILIGPPLDKTRLPRSSMGMALSDITGIVTYQFGYYTILPLTAPHILSTPQPEVAPTTFSSGSHPCEITIGDYNVENMAPRSRHISQIAQHIVDYLHTPDILFLQEIQDDSGPRNDGVTTANRTLAALVKAIARVHMSSHRVKPSVPYSYSFVDIPPEDNMDGGKPGGNIRVAYLWRSDKVALLPGTRGNATQATSVIKDDKGGLTLSLNPGRVNPQSAAWEETRKPLAAAWQTITGERFFTVNVHLSSKRDSSSQHGDARPPVNGHSYRRMQQVNTTVAFIESILAKDPSANVILAGDMNEYVQARSVFRPLEHLLIDINDAAGVDPVERYTYVYEQRTQEIDHIFVSDAVAKREIHVEHVHVNTWARTTGERASDHDPTVAKVWVCDKPTEIVDGGDRKLLVQEPVGYGARYS